MNKTPSPPSHIIATHAKASHDYTLEDRFEAGLVLEGWEVKSLRDHRVQLRDSYVIFKRGEAWLVGAHITPLPTASTHIQPDPQRSRKLLLNQHELNKLYGAVQRKGYTLVPLNLHWRKNRVKIEIALGKGKKTFDKREALRRREWEREKARTLKRR
ncbi:MAG: SsrA-binding protein [Coxiella sp. RIFCSPHIGHO2_12_FULL_44_14]|nr:MAG: SsrA-binding protein [Coxiella sp. RIFCSPHIGHO2_12_FULL_44_14]